MSQHAIPITIEDSINARILAVSEDRIHGFASEPFAAIAERSGLSQEIVLERIRAMLEAGVIRRVRQTFLANKLAPGALVAWRTPSEKLDAVFEYMAREDPFTGHVVIRSTDPATPGGQYRLWTTLKVPQGFSMERHSELLMRRSGASACLLMPAKKLFTLGVGHVRRRKIEPGSKTDAPGEIYDTEAIKLSDDEWRVVAAIKDELALDEIVPEPWRKRAAEAGIDYDELLGIAARLNARGVVGRFSTFLEHVKQVAGSERVTRFNALFHWRVPPGCELAAGREVGRFHVMTHAYWREGGPEFRNVNIMGVAHGLEKEKILAHKAAIDAHLQSVGIPIEYTSIFWGGRSEIKPSEILPQRYAQWCASIGVDPDMMREPTPH